MKRVRDAGRPTTTWRRAPDRPPLHSRVREDFNAWWFVALEGYQTIAPALAELLRRVQVP